MDINYTSIDCSINERIKRIADYLFKGNTSAMARSTAIKQSTLRDIIGERQSTPSYDTIKEIVDCATINVNPDWLITGKGSMLKTAEESSIGTPEEQTSEESNTVNYRLVPLLNLDAVGGMHDLNTESDGSEYIERLIPFTDAQDGDIALFISGNSMDPTCPAGSKVLIREVTQWNEYFGFGNIFVLLLTDGRRILKEVQKWQEDPKNFVLCRSHNDKYPEEELPKSMIAGVWKVIKILNERGW